MTGKCLIVMVSMVIIFSSRAYAGDGDSTSQLGFTVDVSTSISAPLFGTIELVVGKPVTERLVGRAFIAYFNRDWMPFLPDADEWSSKSFYWGLMCAYYPFGKGGAHTGWYIGGDIGMAASKQTYVPLKESQFVYFPFIDLYLFGYTLLIGKNVALDFMLGGGYAPVSHVVNIKGHVNKGDWYPVGDIRVGFRW